MEHLSSEILSEYLDGGVAAGAEEHLSSCPLCLGELEALRELRGQLRTLPDLEAPPALWSAIEARLPLGRRFRWFRIGSPAWVAMQTAAAAAVFVLGLGLGRVTTLDDSVTETSGSPLLVSRPTATTLTGAMEDVRLRREEYDAALRQLESIARQTGRPVPSVAEERLAALDVLVEASRAALAAEPADPVLNSYLFAATDQRADVLREIRANPTTDSDVLWR